MGQKRCNSRPWSHEIFLLYSADERKADGEIITKHDQQISERKNAKNVEQVGRKKFKILLIIERLKCIFSIASKFYQNLKVFSVVFSFEIYVYHPPTSLLQSFQSLGP